MSGYTPLFNSIITSSIWQEPNHVRIIWITLLAMSDASGKVEGSIPGLANVANVTISECSEAIEILSTPDLYSRTKDFEGRRIHKIEGGWQIYNLKRFREKAKSRAAYMRDYREKKKKEANKEKQTKETNTNNNKQGNLSVTGVTVTNVTNFVTPPDKRKWNDIAFQVGLTDEEAQKAYENYGANGWKRANNAQTKIESWEQVPHLLTYWRNHREEFTNKKEESKAKIGSDGLTAGQRAELEIQRDKNVKSK